MRRRDFITLVGGATTAWSFAVHAQQGQRMPRVGVLIGYAESDPEVQARLAAFREGLEKLGWREGRDLQIDYRFAPANVEQAARFAKELVALQPNVLVGNSTPAAAALQRETRALPIVFVGVSDPIGSGFVNSIPRPGGNITGFSNFDPSLIGKWLELLKGIAPRIARAAVLFNPDTAPDGGAFFLEPFGPAARTLSVESIAAPAHDPAGIESALTALGAAPGGSLIVMPDAFTTVHRELIIELAARFRLPAIYPYRYHPASGGLMSYGVDTVDLFRRAAPYVDRLLKGEKPGDLPVQAPTKFEFVINLKTARALELEIPPMLLALTDEVIE
jgi:putative tryptophan/tyrosine transport system substrate-binding protein